MTIQEKAKRYDALQAAIQETMEMYATRMNNADDRINTAKNEYVIGFNGGMRTTYEIVIQTMERWIDG